MFGYNPGFNNNNPIIGQPMTMNLMMNRPMINNNGIMYNPNRNIIMMNYIPVNPPTNVPVMNNTGVNMNVNNGGNLPAIRNTDANSPGYLNIIFENIGNGKVNMQVSPNESVETVINKYKIRSNMQENDIKFIYNGSQLNYSLSVADSGLMDASIVTVLSLRNVCGA